MAALQGSPLDYLVTTHRVSTDQRLVTANSPVEAAAHAYNRRGRIVSVKDDGCQVSDVSAARGTVAIMLTSHHAKEGILVATLLLFFVLAGVVLGVAWHEQILGMVESGRTGLGL